MRITYLVLAHAKPGQFARLLRRLTAHDEDHVLAHIDAKADQGAFEAVAPGAVRFTPDRVDVRWGGFGSVDAELHLLRHALRTDQSDYYVLLSGVDYPIKSRTALAAELESGAAYLESWPMPDAEHRKPMNRLSRFFIAPKDRSNRVFHELNRALLVGPPRNVTRGLGGRRPFGGSQWWGLPRACAEQVIRTVDADPRLVRFFRRSRNPDEMFFQTVVENLPDAFEIRRQLTWAYWQPDRREFGGTAPATLTTQDVPVLLARPEFFARKFDLDRAPDVFDVLDANLA